MRVTHNNLYSTSLGQIQDKRSKMLDIQNKLATQKEINKPSDNPVGATKVMSIRENNSNDNQFQSTCDKAEIFLNYTDTALGEFVEVINRAKELTIGQSSDPSGNEDSRIALAEEIEQLYFQTLGIANRRIGERFIFGGFKTVTGPFNEFGEYLGDEGLIKYEVTESTFLPVNIPGSEAFHGKNIRDGVNVFNILRGLHTALMTNDTKMVQSFLEPLDNARRQAIQLRARVGSRVNAIKEYKDGMELGKIDNLKLKSEIEDADIVKAASDLKKEEDLLNSSLNATNRLLQPSLISFLK